MTSPSDPSGPSDRGAQPPSELAGKQELAGRELKIVMDLAGRLIEDLKRHVRDPDRAARDLAMLTPMVAQAGELTDTLLAIGRAEVSLLRRPWRRIDLNEFLSEREAVVRRTTHPRILVSLQLFASNSHITANPDELESIVFRLIESAKRAMPSGGELVVSTGRLGYIPHGAASLALEPRPHVRLTISDSGTRREEDLHRRVLERPNSQPGQEPAPSIAWMVRRLGGSLILENDPNEGSRVHVCLPADSSDPHATPAASPR